MYKCIGLPTVLMPPDAWACPSHVETKTLTFGRAEIGDSRKVAALVGIAVGSGKHPHEENIVPGRGRPHAAPALPVRQRMEVSTEKKCPGKTASMRRMSVQPTTKKITRLPMQPNLERARRRGSCEGRTFFNT